MKKFTSSQLADKGVIAIAVSQFGSAFAYNVVMVILPFYILKISPLGHQATMLWIGMIVGGAGISTTLVSPLWGALTARMSPKVLFELGLCFSAVITLCMGFTGNIYLLFLLRVIQGALGGTSTIGLILTSALSKSENIRSNMSLFQISITVGQLLGPPTGAYIAAFFGYRFPFYTAFVLLFLSFFFCHRAIGYIPPQGEPPRTERSMKRGLLFGWILCFIATIDIVFLPSVLPAILDGFHLAEDGAVSTAGTIMMAYTASAIVGSYLICRMADRMRLKTIMTVSLLASALFQILFVFVAGVTSFTLVRMLQTAFIAAVLPLTIAAFARQVGGKMIGFLNSSRFLGNALGPLIATAIVAYTDLYTLYMAIAGLTLASLWFFLASMPVEEGERS